ncbi:hypothetical protein C2845_PM09G03720 [Panicum miliaceum]|uniref:Uncharacterized protein n=1 Tax=Panicum miliaceum TaxID=4540 RepID=A0A3L6S3S9_PANMI|nr:hypothetical protein C2845_PM09G03720 [Panicum miliaceum]
MPGQGFYSMHLPTDKAEKKREVLGIMVIEQGTASIEVTEKELTHLFKDVQNWPIKKLQATGEYLITFPSEAIREQLSRFKGFDFLTSEVKAKVLATDSYAEADDKLEVVWVKAFNLPSRAKAVEVVMELAYIVGDPEEVDLNSLHGTGPVRMKIACRDANMIRGETQVFFNGESYRIGWKVEKEGIKQANTKTTSKFDRQKDKDEEDEEGEDDGDFLKAQANTWRHFRNDKTKAQPTETNKPGGSSAGTKQREVMEETEINENQKGAQEDVEMTSPSYQSTGKLDGKDNTQAEEEGEIPTQQSVSMPDQAPVPNLDKGEEELLDYGDETIVDEKKQMEQLEKTFEERADRLIKSMAVNFQDDIETVSDTAMGSNIEIVDLDSSENIMEVDEVISNIYGTNDKDFVVVKAKGKKSPTITQQKSLRNSNAKGTVQGNAEAIKQKLNDLSGNSFVVLNSINAAQLKDIASVSNINLGDSEERVEENISLLQAQAAARATLANAKKKLEVEKKRLADEGMRDSQITLEGADDHKANINDSEVGVN